MIWLAYFVDWSGMAVFTEEIECLRYAVKKGMNVVDIKPGQSFGPGQDPTKKASGSRPIETP